MDDDVISALEAIDPSRADRFADGSIHPLMKRLRQEAPVHYCASSEHGPFWSITRHADIREIELQPERFSSSYQRGGVSLIQPPGVESLVTFIQMDPPDHGPRRQALVPAFSAQEMTRLSENIRNRTSDLLDQLPRGKTFDWVSDVSVRLTTDMLATLFDFPWEDRHLLPEWTDWIVSLERIQKEPQGRMEKMGEMAAYFLRLWQERASTPEAPDLLSRMIHSGALGHMDAPEFLGNMATLVVGGNDTTRNTMSGLAIAFDQWPEEREKLYADTGLIITAVPEAIRWQSPAAHMRRTVTEDTEFRGKTFKAGDSVVMWYISGNRDEAVFENPDRFIADRKNARDHIAFGYGIHRCLGARLAELQLRILLEEMASRKVIVRRVGPVVREAHPFLTNVLSVPVELH
ncbi:cytochrome P450 [Hyphomonas sp.]|uniref:cytochrome P450 n=1 Tax=Hyphomonas sp. TaxID=87 RepID=UPI0025BA1112|nr:cytochrome P450 [Hyphomonas sp.]MBI1399562.1 cytochrome P450 [Hyphomonas sp.]